MNKIEIITIKNAPIDSNCFLIIDSETKNAIVIDPGSQDCTLLISAIEYHKAIVEYIILTHEHFDHVWGVNTLKERYNSHIICSEECGNKIIDRKKNLSVFYNQIGFDTHSADIQFNTPKLVVYWHLNIIELFKTKGHSEGSICIMINNFLFTGDTIIKDSKTVIKLPDSSRSELILSLNLLISICNKSTLMYPGHGDSFKFEDFRKEQCV